MAIALRHCSCRYEGFIRQWPKIRDARNDAHAWCGEPRNLAAMKDGIVRDGVTSRIRHCKARQHAAGKVVQACKPQEGRVR